MGLLQKMKDRFQNSKYYYAKMFSNREPVFSQFGENVYASDIVQSVISCIVTEMTKLNPIHVKRKGQERIPINDSIKWVLDNPNELMTTSDFISKILWNLFLNYNSIVYPMYETITNKDGSKSRKYIGLYPLQPKKVEFVKDTTETLYIRMTFQNGKVMELPYSDVIHIKYRYSFNDYMGGNSLGQPDNEALLKLLSMNHEMYEGILKAMKTSFNLNGFVKYNTMMDQKKMETAMKEFNDQLLNNASGFMGLDLKSEVIQLNRNITIVDPETLKFIDSRILRMFGVSVAILDGSYTKADYQSFYQKTLEPLIISISQAFGKTLFTDREKQLGHEVIFLTEPLLFLDTTQKIEAVRLLGDAGEMYSNEKRLALGLEPLPELEGVRMQSLNYVNVEHAREYQVGGEGNEE